MIRLKVPVEQIVEYIRKAEEIETHAVFVPIGDMKNYWDKTINYGYILSSGHKFLPKRINTYKTLPNKDNLNLEEIDKFYFGDNDYIIFEFESEEEALYFKLKFCL